MTAGNPVPVNGQFRAMLGTDIVGFTRPERRDEETRQYMREAFYTNLKCACLRSGIPWSECRKKDQGDGVLVTLPPGDPPASLVEPLTSHLRTFIRRYNRMSVEAAQMQVRASVHIGMVYEDDHGLTGDDLTYLCRMLDSGPLRKAIAGSGAEVAVAVSDHIYKTVVQRNPSLANPAGFRHRKCRVKGNPVDLWLHVPGEEG